LRRRFLREGFGRHDQLPRGAGIGWTKKGKAIGAILCMPRFTEKKKKEVT